MCGRSILVNIGLFVLSLLIGVAVAVLSILGFLTLTNFVPLAASFAFLILLAALGVAVAAAGGDDEAAGTRRRALCGCARDYLRPAVISALIALVLALALSGFSTIPILSGIILGLIALSLLFAAFLLAAFLFCLLDTVCHRCVCDPGDPCENTSRSDSCS